jgi:hypothetical protein
MTGDISLFIDFKAKKKGYVTYGDNNKGAILGKGISFDDAGVSTEDILKEAVEETDQSKTAAHEKEEDTSHEEIEEEKTAEVNDLPTA